MNKFDQAATTIAALTKNKKPECVSALTSLFDTAVVDGHSFREAFWKADLLHFLEDHDGYNHLPQLTIPTDAPTVRQAIIDAIMATNETNDDGKTEDRLDYIIRWFDLLISWGAPAELALTIAPRAGQEEWEDVPANDMDETLALTKIHEIPSEKARDFFLSAFQDLRGEGNSVWASLRDAHDATEDFMRLEKLRAIFGGGLDLEN